MYLQILMREENRDACRFLWWDGERRIRSYRLTRVCFGLKCSPFLAMGTVRSHAQRHEESAPRAAKEVLNNMYMDDLATSCNSVEEAQTLVDQLDSLLASGGSACINGLVMNPTPSEPFPQRRPRAGREVVLGRRWEFTGSVTATT
ncbi:hypothetical protein T4D_13377 [Trichinella pseudospiralis]|uniref:Reverse transcriptase domain-containing protein n=1 Tax=Trichinella pseudospiralis TaxID=6337 RepID=A0A0V1FLC0_TRIPS|nr:hypothetical protein T4D_13377 [Trichinella pseudospiralis]